MKLNKEFKLLLSLIIFFIVSNSGIATEPYFADLHTGDVLQVTEDQLYLNWTMAIDDDEHYPLNFTYGEDTQGLTSFDFYTYNATHGIFNFTPTNDEVGMHQVILIVRNTNDEIGFVLVYFNVSNTNDPPNITWYHPEELQFEMYENNTVGFYFDYNATDPDIRWGDYLTNYYYLDGVNVTSAHNWTYKTGFCEPNNHIVKLIVWDNYGLNDTITWNITHVTNVNRKPSFNISNPIPNITFAEDTVLENAFALFPDRFYDPDYFCDNRPDTLSFTVIGSDNITVSVNQSYPFYVSFQPERDFNGVRNVTILLFDGYATTYSNMFFVNVTPVPDDPRLTPIPNQTVYVAAPFIYQVNASDPEHGNLTYFDDTPLFQIDLLTGLINYTPKGDEVGTYEITITVYDDTGLSNSTTFDLTVLPNHPPWIEPIPNQVVAQNATFVLNVTAHDADSDIINITMSTDKFEKIWYNDTAAIFSYLPKLNGTYNVTVFATDSKGAVNTTWFIMNVSYYNFPPTIEPIPPQVAKIGKPYSYNVTADDGNMGTETLTFSDNTTLFAIDPATGIISFTPQPSDRGNYTVNITVWDDGIPPKNNWTIAMFEVTYNRPPEILNEPGNKTAFEDFAFVYDVNAIDKDNDPLVFMDNTTLFDIDSVTGLINFTPTLNLTNKTYFINISVMDTDNATDWTVLVLKIEETNDPPYFDPPLRELINWSNITEEYNYKIYVNVTDEENDSINFELDFLNCTNETGCTWPFNITVLSHNPGRALINFTPNDENLGKYIMNLSITDSFGNTNWENVTIVILNKNDPPEILEIYPYGRPLSLYTTYDWVNVSEFEEFSPGYTEINVSEEQQVLFNQKSWDVDNVKLYYEWKLNNTLVGNESTLNYYFDYNSKRNYLLTLRVYDDDNASDSFHWGISVENLNRLPVFGNISYETYDDFINGSFNNTVVNASGWVCLNKNASGFLESGTYTSEVIDLKARNLLNISNLGYSAVKPENTKLLFAVRVSPNNISWSNWSSPYDPKLLPFPKPSFRYVQYKAILTTSDITNTPCIDKVWVAYKIGNFTIKNNNIYSSVLNLKDYFYDLDTDDTLVFGADSYEHMKVFIEDNYNVRIEPNGEYYGDDYLRFYAEDNESKTYSNTIKVTILQGSGESTQSQSTSSNTRIIMQTQIKKEKETEYAKFNLLAPEEVTVYKNESVLIPIKLTNPTNETLYDIKLNASTAIQGINFTFTKDHFEQLIVGESVNTSLWMEPYKIAGTYEVVVSAYVREPKTNDSVKVMVNSREKGQHNASMVNTKIAFTQDLLGGHPECFELNEQLSEAQIAYQNGEYAKAEALVQKVVENCRYLIKEKGKVLESPKPTGKTIIELFNNDNFVLSILLGFVLLVGIGLFLLYKKT